MLLIENPEIILVSTIFFSIFLIFYVKFIRIMVPDDQIHVIKNKKNTMFFGKCIDRREYYYNFPIWVPVYGIEEKTFFRNKKIIAFDAIKHGNLYKESFESDIEISVKIIEPLKTIKFNKSYEWVIALLKRDMLIEIKKEISNFDGNEIIENSNEINSTLEKELTKTANRYWIQISNLKIINTRKTSEQAEIPKFQLDKIAKLWEEAYRNKENSI